MAALVTQPLVNAGTKPTFGAASTADTCEVGSGFNNFAIYKNASGAAVTLTIVVPGSTTYGQPLPDPTFTIPATTGEVWIPILAPFNNGSQLVDLQLSLATSVTVAIVQR